MTLPVLQIQRFCMHDGPGLRTTVFFKGCPLRCRWCHNPESQSPRQELLYDPRKCIGCGACAAVCPAGAHRIGDGGHTFDRAFCRACGACAAVCPTEAAEVTLTPRDTDEILDLLRRDRSFFGESGGLTLSGGEPLSHPAEALDLLTAARCDGFSCAVETCGRFDPAYREDFARAADLFLWDVKDTDEERHRKNTGVGLAPILDNLRAVDRLGARTRLRCIVIGGVNDTESHWQAVLALRDSLEHCEGVDLLPYHAMGGSKYPLLDRSYACDDCREPSEERMAQLRALFE